MSEGPDRAPPPRSTPHVEARRLDGAAGPRAATGEFTYSVGAPAAAQAPRRPPPATAAETANAEKRRASRQRTRLRTGKLLDVAGRFLTECLVFDRSDTGCRLRLPADVTLPGKTVHFFDDQRDAMSLVDIAWRKERDLGVRLRPAPDTPQIRALAAEMRRRFYAVPK